MAKTTATMERGKKTNWGLLAVGGLAVWYLFFRKPTTGTTAQIMGISVDGAPMGAHLIQKKPGENATISVSWTASTKNAAGALVGWPYYVQVKMFLTGSSTLLADTSGPEEGAGGGAMKVTSMSLAVPAGVTPGQTIAVQAFLNARTSLADGAPASGPNDWQLVASSEHPAAIQVVSSSTPAVPGGAIGTIGVAQRGF